MYVKVCGLNNIIDSEWAIEAGADGLGFVMGGKVLPIEIEPGAQLVREIISKLSLSADTFLVTHLLKAKDILDLANYIGCSAIQVSEYIGTREMNMLRKSTSKKIIKTIVVNDTDFLQRLEEYSPYCDMFLTDSRANGYIGGTGLVNDWKRVKILLEENSKSKRALPVLLSGGLSPENINSALSINYTYGVDVSTGVSEYHQHDHLFLRKDRKSKERINKFISLFKGFKI